MQALNDFISRITRSSSDPEKLALTLKGFILWAVPIAIYLVNAICNAGSVCIDPGSIAPLGDLLINVVQVGAGIAASIIMLVGLVRKLLYGQWSAA